MKGALRLGLAFAASILASPGEDQRKPEPPLVYRVRLENQSINPVSARFVSRAIDLAEKDRAECLILILDTPGGLADSTRELTKRILDSRVPIVVYVAPPGGRAASAGLFITIAAHVAAMAPGTNIGAAYPVQIRGLPVPEQPGRDSKKEGEKPDRSGDDRAPMEEKVVNDTVSWARSLAELRGRNVEWVSRAVKEAASASATEALNNKVIDIVAGDFDGLMEQLDGRSIAMPERVTLKTAGAQVRRQEMWWGDRILTTLANPNIAFLLLILGFYGILLEFYTPGWGVAGTLGAIFLALGFFSMAVLPINYAGLLLIALGLALLVAEAFFTSYGALTLGGIICLSIGGLMLVDSPPGFLRISIWTVLPIALATAAITVFLVSRIVRSHRLPARTGTEGLLGLEAVAQDEFTPLGDHYAGLVRAHGELWRALSDESVRAGQVLRVQGSEGLTLLVSPPPANKEERVTGIRPEARETPSSGKRTLC